MNGCLAHNIYLTYYDYRKSYEKRIKLYRISALIISGIIYLVTLVNLDFNSFYNKNNSDKSSNKANKRLSFDMHNEELNDLNTKLLVEESDNTNYKNFVCFQENFTVAFYVIGIIILGYISHNLYYIVNKDHDYISFAQGKLFYSLKIILFIDDPRDATIKMLVRELVKRNVFLLSYTLFSFLPNNLIFFLKYFFGKDFLNIWNYLNYIMIAIISFNACYSILIIVSDSYMRKFFKPYYNLFNFFKSNNKANKISKLSDLIELVKDDGHDLTRNFLLNKTVDYNYANIYLRTEQQEMKYLPHDKNLTSDFGKVNVFSFKKDSDENLNKLVNTDNNLNIINQNHKSSSNLIIEPKNDNENYQYKITLQNSELNLVKQNSNNSINEKYNNLISQRKTSQFHIGNKFCEIHNKKDKDDVSETSNNRRRDNSIDIASMNSCESADLLTFKKTNFNKNRLGKLKFFDLFKIKYDK